MLLAMLKDISAFKMRDLRGQTMLIVIQLPWLNECKPPKYSCDLCRSVLKPDLVAYHQQLLHRISASPLDDADFPTPTSHPTQSLDYLSCPLSGRLFFDKLLGDD